MAAYVIADVHVRDSEHYEQYKERVPATVAAYGGRMLVRGGETQVFEGDREPGRMILIEFETTERARAWWNSEEYAELKSMRQATATSSLILLDGV